MIELKNLNTKPQIGTMSVPAHLWGRKPSSCPSSLPADVVAILHIILLYRQLVDGRVLPAIATNKGGILVTVLCGLPGRAHRLGQRLDDLGEVDLVRDGLADGAVAQVLRQSRTLLIAHVGADGAAYRVLGLQAAAQGSALWRWAMQY